ncbi:GyrI-like domain-containing protein [Actinoplanes sp. NPDC049265]|uniref:GyrI-like domain-containing protein n=1 Tax=Actinoplanes sp. NPDC049265 TaxID=3363902 RepID=UPI003713E7CD
MIVAAPGIARKPLRHTAGLRVTTPFRGMFAVRDKLMISLYAWLDAHEQPHAETFFRLHVVDMNGPMDVELGVIVPEPVAGDDQVRPGTLPAGDYATLTYMSKARSANGTLIDWIRASGRRAAVREDPSGDEFAARYELYLTDPRTERMKTRWHVELSILLT